MSLKRNLCIAAIASGLIAGPGIASPAERADTAQAERAEARGEASVEARQQANERSEARSETRPEPSSERRDDGIVQDAVDRPNHGAEASDRPESRTDRDARGPDAAETGQARAVEVRQNTPEPVESKPEPAGEDKGAKPPEPRSEPPSATGQERAAEVRQNTPEPVGSKPEPAGEDKGAKPPEPRSEPPGATGQERAAEVRQNTPDAAGPKTEAPPEARGSGEPAARLPTAAETGQSRADEVRRNPTDTTREGVAPGAQDASTKSVDKEAPPAPAEAPAPVRPTEPLPTSRPQETATAGDPPRPGDTADLSGTQIDAPTASPVILAVTEAVRAAEPSAAAEAKTPEQAVTTSAPQPVTLAAAAPTVAPSAAAPGAAPAAAAPLQIVEIERGADGFERRAGELLISGPEVTAETLTQAGLAVLASYPGPSPGTSLYVARATGGESVEAALARMQVTLPGATIGANHVYRLAAGSARTAAPSALARVAGGLTSRVGVIDTGASREGSGPALSDARGFSRRGYTPAAHGAAVVQVAALHGARSVVADVFDVDASGAPAASADAIVRALDWLAGEGVAVVNISIQGPPNPLLAEAVRRSVVRGQIVVAAAGNEGPAAPPVYPAAYPDAVAVTAVDDADRPYRRANRGDYIAFAAAGVNLVLPVGGETTRVSGTSFAAPAVAANLSRRLAKPSTGGAARALAGARRDARDLGAPGRDPVFGWGRVGD